VKCHGADGTARAARRLLPDIPDFTRGSWQRRRSNAQLLVSILDGKGTGMPAFRGKITTRQARDLVGHVRRFAPTTKTPRQDHQERPAQGSFDDRYRRLQKQLDELKRQFRELSEGSADRQGPPPPPSRSSPRPPSRPAESSP